MRQSEAMQNKTKRSEAKQSEEEEEEESRQIVHWLNWTEGIVGSEQKH